MQPHRRQPTRLPDPWDSPGKNTGVGCHFLLQCMKMIVKSLSHVRLPATPWTAAYQAPPSMGFSRQEYWNGVPLPSPNYWWSLANSSWFVDTSLQSLPPSSLCPNFLFLIKTLDIVLGPTFTHYDLNFTSAKIRFPSKFTLVGSRG